MSLNQSIEEKCEAEVIILSINARFSHSSLSGFYLKNQFKKAGYNAHIFEYSINSSLHKIVRKLFSIQPAIITFTI